MTGVVNTQCGGMKRVLRSYRMAINVFCDRVNDNVCAMVERILNVGAEEGIIDHDHDAISVGHGGDVPNVH